MEIDWDAIELWLEKNEDFDLRVGRYLSPGTEGFRWRATFCHSDLGDDDGDEEIDNSPAFGGHILGKSRVEAIYLVSLWARGELP